MNVEVILLTAFKWIVHTILIIFPYVATKLYVKQEYKSRLPESRSDYAVFYFLIIIGVAGYCFMATLLASARGGIDDDEPDRMTYITINDKIAFVVVSMFSSLIAARNAIRSYKKQNGIKS